MRTHLLVCLRILEEGGNPSLEAPTAGESCHLSAGTSPAGGRQRASEEKRKSDHPGLLLSQGHLEHEPVVQLEIC